MPVPQTRTARAHERTRSGCRAAAKCGPITPKTIAKDRHYDTVTAIESGDASIARQTILEHMDGAAANLVA